MKLTKKQLDSIKNAKTRPEAYEALKAMMKPADEAYKAIVDPAYEAFLAIKETASEAYREIYDPAHTAYLYWRAPKPNYSKMTKAELIKLLEEKDE